MNEAARRSYRNAHSSIRQARQFKLSGCPNLMANALADARWHRDQARKLAKA
ncbi:TPA: hypothetical protein NIB55_005859 [Pseudomonas aeruginosa]|nr:hypothetical protein [Pseudomonas aeruginosa]